MRPGRERRRVIHHLPAPRVADCPLRTDGLGATVASRTSSRRHEDLIVAASGLRMECGRSTSTARRAGKGGEK